MVRHIIRLNDRWALSADNLQWIVEHYRPPKWHRVAFIASNKAVLMRVLREKGVVITPAAPFGSIDTAEPYLDAPDPERVAIHPLANGAGKIVRKCQGRDYYEYGD